MMCGSKQGNGLVKNINIKSKKMQELINKLSSYNLLNYLFPGIIFVVLLKETTDYDWLQSNILEGVFLYYFIGLVINRIGSLIIGPILEKLNFIMPKTPERYYEALKKDTKIDVLSETNNMFRSISAVFFVLIFFVIFELSGLHMNWENGITRVIVLSLIFILLIFSYRKQIILIGRRVDANLKN